MNGSLLEKARETELLLEKEIPKNERPSFHLTPRIGWMNDPNGFSYYKENYHMFYQYHPYKTEWGPMHWGHAVSKDLISWENLPVSLAPDEEYDIFGCFSGSAIELEDGQHLLMYTGVKKEIKGKMDSPDIQTQCLALGDGVEYKKWKNNPILTEQNLPAGASKVDFRDPKIWKEKDGTYRCVVGSKKADGNGQIVLYKSKDALEWEYEGVLIQNKNQFGRMWECPDFFELDGKWVLMVSPQDMTAQGLEYSSGNGTLCLIGTWDGTGEFEPEQNQSIDYGMDFYAPQTVIAPDGRRIMIGWMQNWDTCSVRKEHTKWFGQMSLPREISIKEGRLIQNPIKELEAYRKNPVKKNEIEVIGKSTVEGVNGREIDLTVEINPSGDGMLYESFSIVVAENEENHTRISYSTKDSVLKMDRRYAGSRRACIHQRECKIKQQDGKIKVRIILDKYSVEVFVNDGEQAMTMCIYTDLKADGIHFEAEGKVVMNIEKYELHVL
ncbi:MAG: glycoside hydrolase family 32 protein [Lachnospiraceae bacterium]